MSQRLALIHRIEMKFDGRITRKMFVANKIHSYKLEILPCAEPDVDENYPIASDTTTPEAGMECKQIECKQTLTR
jgi:hypothetical protein